MRFGSVVLLFQICEALLIIYSQMKLKGWPMTFGFGSFWRLGRLTVYLLVRGGWGACHHVQHRRVTHPNVTAATRLQSELLGCELPWHSNLNSSDANCLAAWSRHAPFSIEEKGATKHGSLECTNAGTRRLTTLILPETNSHNSREF